MTKHTSQPLCKILKIGQCKTLTNKGDLSYQIGCNDQSEILMRITSNSGGGWFSADWVSLPSIMSAIQKAPRPLTSYALQSLFKGKSVNTAAFLFAALKQEGLVIVDPDNPRCYSELAPDHFIADMKILVDLGASLKDDVALISKAKSKASTQTIDRVPVIFPASKAVVKKLKSVANKEGVNNFV
jgi:hypothetical protein